VIGRFWPPRKKKKGRGEGKIGSARPCFPAHHLARKKGEKEGKKGAGECRVNLRIHDRFLGGRREGGKEEPVKPRHLPSLSPKLREKGERRRGERRRRREKPESYPCSALTFVARREKRGEEKKKREKEKGSATKCFLGSCNLAIFP